MTLFSSCVCGNTNRYLVFQARAGETAATQRPLFETATFLKRETTGYFQGDIGTISCCVCGY